MIKSQFTIIDPIGLHARPASCLVRACAPFTSEIKLLYEGREANLKSIISVMALGVPTGAQITISAEGTDAEEAIKVITSRLKAEKLVAD